MVSFSKMVSPQTVIPSVAFTALYFIAGRWFKKHEEHPLNHRSNASTEPMWSWCVSLGLQVVVYPTLFVLAVGSRYYRGEESSGSWLTGEDVRTLSDNGSDLMYLRAILYTFFGNLVGSLVCTEVDALFVLHHICCMLGILATLETGSPGAVPAALGIFSLEVGSLMFNAWNVDGVLSRFPAHFPWWPKISERAWTRSYFCCFTASNIYAAYFLYKATTVSYQTGYTAFTAWGAFSGLILVCMRQESAVKHITGKVGKPKMLDLIQTEDHQSDKRD